MLCCKRDDQDLFFSFWSFSWAGLHLTGQCIIFRAAIGCCTVIIFGSHRILKGKKEEVRCSGTGREVQAMGRLGLIHRTQDFVEGDQCFVPVLKQLGIILTVPQLSHKETASPHVHYCNYDNHNGPVCLPLRGCYFRICSFGKHQRDKGPPYIQAGGFVESETLFRSGFTIHP